MSEMRREQSNDKPRFINRSDDPRFAGSEISDRPPVLILESTFRCCLKRGGPDDPSNMQWQTIEERRPKTASNRTHAVALSRAPASRSRSNRSNALR